MDLDNTAELIPVSQWVYNLYKVSFWDSAPELFGKVISTMYIAASCENHLKTDANDNAPGPCTWITWEVVCRDVAQPRKIGIICGLPLFEDGVRHGAKLAATLQLT